MMSISEKFSDLRYTIEQKRTNDEARKLELRNQQQEAAMKKDLEIARKRNSEYYVMLNKQAPLLEKLRSSGILDSVKELTKDSIPPIEVRSDQWIAEYKKKVDEKTEQGFTSAPHPDSEKVNWPTADQIRDRRDVYRWRAHHRGPIMLDNGKWNTDLRILVVREEPKWIRAKHEDRSIVEISLNNRNRLTIKGMNETYSGKLNSNDIDRYEEAIAKALNEPRVISKPTIYAHFNIPNRMGPRIRGIR